MHFKGLTATHRHEWNRAAKIKKYLAHNQTVVDSFLPLKQKQAEYDLRIASATPHIETKLFVTTGATTEKKELKAQIGIYYDQICSLVRSYLLDKKITLPLDFRLTKRTFTHLADVELLPLVMEINKVITDKLLPLPDFADYDITAAQLAQGLTLAQQFNQMIGRVPNYKVKKKVAAQDLGEIFHELKQDARILSLLVNHFRQTNPDFFNGFKAVSRIDNTGIHHNILKGKVTLGGQPFEGATIVCEQNGKSATTNILGEYEFPRQRPGLKEFTCTIPGHFAKSDIIKILRGKHIQHNWQFE